MIETCCQCGCAVEPHARIKEYNGLVCWLCVEEEPESYTVMRPLPPRQLQQEDEAA